MRRALLLAGLALAILAAPAGATVTATNITVPGDPFESTAMLPGARTLHVAGTATGTGSVVVYCLNGAKQISLSGLLTVSAGAFSGDIDLDGRTGFLCRLRAYTAAATPPSDLEHFTGPAVKLGYQGLDPVADGPNKGKTSGFEREDPRFGGDWVLDDSRCSLSGGELTDHSDFARTASLWLCAGSLSGRIAPESRTTIRVDGVDAYPSSDADDGWTGWQPISATFSGDSSVATIVSEEPVLRCTDATYPPDNTRCGTVLDTGVRLERTITETLDGAAIDITDTFRSTGAAHAVDLEYDELAGDGTANHVGWQFPGDMGYSLHGAGDKKTISGTGPLTIKVASQISKIDEVGQTAGTLTLSPAPAAVHFIDESEAVYPVTLPVPAGGDSAPVQQSFRVGHTAGDVQPLAAVAADHQSPPAVTITAPADGAHVAAGSDLTITGTATDNVGVAKLVVAGQTVTPGAAFSATISVLPGANTFTATATDATGATGAATVHVVGDTAANVTPTPTPPPVTTVKCKVPKLKGLTRKKAAKKLKKAHCRLARKIKHRTTHKRKLRGRVVAQSIKAGTKKAKGTRVKLTLGAKP